MKTENKAVDINRSIGDFHYKVDYAKDAGSGLSEKTIHYISDAKEDPDWVREFRLRGLKTFLEKPLPTHWASKDLEAIDFDKIRCKLTSGSTRKISANSNVRSSSPTKEAKSLTWRAAPRRSSRPRRYIAQWSSWSRSRAPRSNTSPCKTGRPTFSIWSPNAGSRMK